MKETQGAMVNERGRRGGRGKRKDDGNRWIGNKGNESRDKD